MKLIDTNYCQLLTSRLLCAGTDIRRQNDDDVVRMMMTSKVDPRTERVKKL